MYECPGLAPVSYRVVAPSATRHRATSTAVARYIDHSAFNCNRSDGDVIRVIKKGLLGRAAAQRRDGTSKRLKRCCFFSFADRRDGSEESSF